MQNQLIADSLTKNRKNVVLYTVPATPLPYLTKSKDGLAVTRTQYSLFKYTPGSNVAIYVEDIRRTGNIRCDIILTPQQIELIETAIKEDYFFD